MQTYLTLDRVSFAYDKTPVLTDVSFLLKKGESVVLSGQNGSGKSTLLRLILGSLKPQAGTVTLDGDARIGYVPQMGAERLYSFPITPAEMVGLNLYPDGTGFFSVKDDDQKKIEQALIKVAMLDQKDMLFSELSGGQKQRVLIAKALVSNPTFLLLDEPTIGLDQKSRESLYKLLSHFNRSHALTLLIVTHESEGLDQIAHRTVRLSGGELREVRHV